MQFGEKFFVKSKVEKKAENENIEDKNSEISAAKLKNDVIDFRKIVEVAYSKNTVDERFKSSAGIGRFNLLGQRVITAELLKDELLKIYPSIEVKAFSEKKEDNINEQEERAWVEIALINDDKLIINIDKNKSSNNNEEIDIKFKALLKEEDCFYKNGEEINEDFFSKNDSTRQRYQILKKRYENVRNKEEYYDELLRGNIYIVGGTASGKTVLMEKIQEVLPQRAIDIGKLFRTATYLIISDQEENSLQPDIDKIKNGDAEEEERIKALLNYKTRLLENGLLKNTNIIQKEGGNQAVILNSIDITNKLDTLQINTLIPIIAKTPKVRDIVWKWINQHAEKNKGVIVTGHSLKDINITKYKVINLLVKEEVAAIRMFNRNPGSFGSLETAMDLVKKRNLQDKVFQTNEILSNFYSYSTIDSTFLSIDHIKFKALRKISNQAKEKAGQIKDQSENKLERKDFEWQTNPLIAMIRIYGNKIFLDKAKKYKDFGINEFDISIQSMIHLAGYETKEIWNGDEVVLNDIIALVKLGETKEAKNILETKIESGQIRLNSILVEDEAERQCKNIIDIFSKISLNNKLGSLKADIPMLMEYMGKPEYSPFRSVTDPVVDSKKSEKRNNPETGETMLIVREKNSEKKIVIKRVPPRSK
jgi:cytidylate kinase